MSLNDFLIFLSMTLWNEREIVMKFIYKNYEKKYQKSCMELIKTTWQLDEYLETPRQPSHIYRYYLERCVIWSDYLELLVDEQDNVQGILFGAVTDIGYQKKHLKQWLLNTSVLWHILIGDLGVRKSAISVYRGINWEDKTGEKDSDDFDGVINLFILSPSMRGQGYGRILMNRFIENCHKYDVENIFLWTTTKCTFQFYEHYGFSEHTRFPIEISENGNLVEEGIVYYKQLI